MTSPPDFGGPSDPLATWIGTAIRALTDEMELAQRTITGETPVIDGRPVMRGEGRTLLRFRTDAKIQQSPDSPILMRVASHSRRIGGTLVGADDHSVLLDVEDEFAAPIPRAWLSIDANFVLHAQRERLREVLDDPEIWGPLPELLCGLTPPGNRSPKTPVALADSLNGSQGAAVQRALGAEMLFIWGPPGTGKTTTLGHTVAALVRAGQRVLLVAHTNVAVDQALISVARALADDPLMAPGVVVRAGAPATEAARRRPDLLAQALAARELAGAEQEMEALDQMRREVVAMAADPHVDDDQLPSLTDLRRRSVDLRTRLRGVEERLIGSASVLAATSARAAFDFRVLTQSFDTVVIDEASMMGIAPAMVAAGLGRQRVLLFGDFRQLPPVVLSDTDASRKMLHSDAFTTSGARAAVEGGGHSPLVALLDTQYRMSAPIAAAVNRTAYNGRLRTHRTDLGDLSGPWAGHSVVVIDTSPLDTPEVRPTSSGGRAESRTNPVHALICRAVAGRLAEGGQPVAIVTPYRGQMQLITAMCADLAALSPTVSTVHRLQGAEAPRVVIDLVDSGPGTSPSPLTGGDDDLTLRLINVAMSRAQDRLVVVANLSRIESALVRSSPLRRALDSLRQSGQTISATLPDMATRTAPHLVWHPTALAPMVDLLHTSRHPVDLTLPYRLPPAHVDPLADAAARAPAVPTVRTPMDNAEAFEAGPSRLRLQFPASLAMALTADRALVALGPLDTPALDVGGVRTARALRELLIAQ